MIDISKMTASYQLVTFPLTSTCWHFVLHCSNAIPGTKQSCCINRLSALFAKRYALLLNYNSSPLSGMQAQPRPVVQLVTLCTDVVSIYLTTAIVVLDNYFSCFCKRKTNSKEATPKTQVGLAHFFTQSSSFGMARTVSSTGLACTAHLRVYCYRPAFPRSVSSRDFGKGGQNDVCRKSGGATHCGAAQSAAIARGVRGHAPRKFFDCLRCILAHSQPNVSNR